MFDQLVIDLFFGGKHAQSRMERYLRQFADPLKDKKAKADEGDAELDSEEEEGLAYSMFVDDIGQLRLAMKTAMLSVMGKMENLEDQFTSEREFYKLQIEQKNSFISDLQAHIGELGKDLEYERSFNDQTFVEQEVKQLCQRAFFSQKLLENEQLIQSRDEI
jgi:hypothetical protein